MIILPKHDIITYINKLNICLTMRILFYKNNKSKYRERKLLVNNTSTV